MRICMVGHFPPHIGGVSSYTYLLSKKIRERGDKVYILTYPYKNVKYKNLKKDPIKDLKGIKIDTSPTINIKGLRGIIFTLTAIFKLLIMVKKYDIDLIHAHYIIPPGLIAVIAGKISKTPVVLTIHGTDIFILSRKSILKPVIKFILKNSAKIFVVSNAVKKEVMKIDNVEHKTKITWNAVDLERFNPNNKNLFKEKLGLELDKPIILFVGNLVSQKGVEYLIKAKKYIKTDSYLLIVGNGPLQKELKTIVKNEDLKDVLFIGPRDDVEMIMPQCDVVVLPSISESFGIVILEAMASGVPVVATNTGGIPEIVTTDVGIIVEPRNPMAIANAVDQILSDPKLKSELGINAREKALKFSKLEIPY
ncbi:MAG: glycosyltransferase [Methanobacteriaceae archaeon]|nr:glycosyltransferase [Methanobacteriaceae archaeon]